MFDSNKKGQGATEYIVVLAIVLMVALVVVGLLGFFPGFSSDTQTSESSSYWQSAKPVAIIDAIQFSTGGVGQNVTLVIENHAPASITITSINLTSIPSALGAWNATPGGTGSLTMAAGDRGSVMFFNASTTQLPDCAGRSGKTYSYNVSFTYNQDPLSGKAEKGSKPVVVTCT